MRVPGAVRVDRRSPRLSWTRGLLVVPLGAVMEPFVTGRFRHPYLEIPWPGADPRVLAGVSTVLIESADWFDTYNNTIRRNSYLECLTPQKLELGYTTIQQLAD